MWFIIEFDDVKTNRMEDIIDSLNEWGDCFVTKYSNPKYRNLRKKNRDKSYHLYQNVYHYNGKVTKRRTGQTFEDYKKLKENNGRKNFRR